MKEEKDLPYAELTSNILGACFEVMKELGPGFLEKVYKNALFIAMKQKGLQVEVEQPFDVVFNYLKVAKLPVGLLVNFCHRQLEWKRLQSNEDLSEVRKLIEELVLL